jgi:predicted nucleotidyltransferase
MELIERWPHLERFNREAGKLPGIEVWLFGSALRLASPADIDILILYSKRDTLIQLRDADSWSDYNPPIHIIAMTIGEETFYRFREVTGAIPLGGPRECGDPSSI